MDLVVIVHPTRDMGQYCSTWDYQEGHPTVIDAVKELAIKVHGNCTLTFGILIESTWSKTGFLEGVSRKEGL